MEDFENRDNQELQEVKPPVDFQKIRKKRIRMKRLKQLATLLLIGLIILLALYLNDMLVRRNITSQIGGIVDSVGGEGFPASIPSGTVRDVENTGKNLIVLKDSNLYVYNPKGKMIKNIQQMNEKSVVMPVNDRVLYYNIGGREVVVTSATNEIARYETTSNIISATIGTSGEVAIITSPPDFVAQIQVYDNKAHSFYNRSFSENLVSQCALSPKGKQLAVSTFGTNEGVLDFNLFIYPLATTDGADKKVIPLGDRIILDINFFQEDTLTILTDRDFLVYDTVKSQLIGSHSFLEETEIVEFRSYANSVGVLLKDTDTREYILSIINHRGTNVANLNLANRPLDFAMGDKSIYLLVGSTIEEYNYGLSLLSEYQAEQQERIHLIGDTLYLIGKSEITVLDQEKDKI